MAQNQQSEQEEKDVKAAATIYGGVDSSKAAVSHPTARVDAGIAFLPVPKDGLAGLKQNWRSDIVSGFILFLIALPMSLGIAMASGVSPLAGIIAAVVGGICVSQMSGSFVTVNGPAAGLIVVIAGAVEDFGGGVHGYRATLAAIVVAGAVLFVLGRLKAGELGKFFPSSVVHGMLASIGMIIILKQLPIMLGVTPPAKEPVELLIKLPYTISHFNPHVALIGVVSMLILIVHGMVKLPILRKVPAPIMVVIVACAIGQLFGMTTAHDYSFMGQTFSIVPDKMLVHLPSDLSRALSSPDWSVTSLSLFYKAVLTITLIQGIETVLSCAAVDKLDPFKRKANLSKDLSAVGVGSMVSGMLGGLPMIAEIVRSTANIANGARTRFSNFFHGIFIFISVLTATALLNRIPLAALAALLVFTGYRLASPKVFKETHEIGWEQTLLFVTTIIITLSTDLLIGVFSGVAVKLLLHVLRGVKPGELFMAKVKSETLDNGTVVIRIQSAAVFSNYMAIKKVVDRVPPGKDVVFELERVTFIDHTVMEHFHDFERDQSHSGGHVVIKGLALHKTTSSHPAASRKLIIHAN